MRLVLCLALLLTGVAQADQIDDAAHALAMKIAAHLTPQEKPHVAAVRNISTLSAADADRAQTKLEAALPRHSRAKSSVDVALIFSENAAGYLWVAQMNTGAVEMVAVPTDSAPAIPERQLLSKRLLWQQGEPLLDLVQRGDLTVILSSGSVAVIQADKRSDLAIDLRRIRDPRGRLEVDGDALTIYLPGATCRGTVDPLHLDCADGSAEFVLNGEKVRFTPSRNTLAGIRPGDESAGVCEGMKLAATKNDAIALFGTNGVIRDQTELPGSITVLWPANEGAVAVTRNLDTDRYTAYAISVDCVSH